MRHMTCLAAVLMMVAVVVAEEPAFQMQFEVAEKGKVPANWVVAKTGMGEGSVWKVVADETAPSKDGLVLAQTAAGPRPLFNICVAQKPRFKDVEISVAVKAIKGEIDQGGGVVWRYQDPNNYYIARWNPLEENFRVYKVVGGKRSAELSGAEVQLPDGWHTLKIRHIGDKIECYLDDRKYLEANDSTFQSAGQVGVWTKADAHTHFALFKASEAKP